MPTAEKVAVIEKLTEILKRSKGIYLTDFTGLDVPAFTLLRKRLREQDVSYQVVKNRLALLAAKEAGIEGLGEALKGPTGLVCTEGEGVLPARLLVDFAKEKQGRPRVKMGVVEGRVFQGDDLEALARLPSREVILTQMVVAVQGPLSGLVFCLQGLLRKLVMTLQAVAQKREGEGGEAASGNA